MTNKEKILFDNGVHKFVMFSFDDETHGDSYLSVNQYLIVHHGEGILIDPGSENVFSELSQAVEKYLPLERVKYIFLSHQDPDVSGSITQWSVSTNAKFVISALWVRFMSHYGFMDMSRIMALPDHGAKIHFGDEFVQFVPAHFLHSPGNFSLYDSISKILFSGDIGAAIVTSDDSYKHVNSFEEHKVQLEGFHKRYMGSNKLCRAWVSHVRKLDVNIIAPQHGLLFEEKNVALFLDWLDDLQCGSDNISELY
jgi:flavorubredoxin